MSTALQNTGADSHDTRDRHVLQKTQAKNIALCILSGGKEEVEPKNA